MNLFFPGSFDPFTIGHADLVTRALGFADHIVIGIGINPEKEAKKQYLFSADKRYKAIKEHYIDNPQIDVVRYIGLTVDAAKNNGCDAILRGLRTGSDYDYEQNIANINYNINGMETIMLNTLPSMAHVSSSVVREIYKYKGLLEYTIPEFSKYLPK